MERKGYNGSVRNSQTEADRDCRMVELSRQGLAVSVIAQRMGLTVNAVRLRVKRTRALQAARDPSNAKGGV